MLYEAAAWRTGLRRPTNEEVFSNPKIALYIENWGRTGDHGVIAEDNAGRPVGAAWYRLFTDHEHGYGFIDQTMPEITIAVRSEARGRGVGTTMLKVLVDQAREWATQR